MDTERPDPNLSPREQQLLQLAAAGYTDSAIAEELRISEATVGTYWGRIRIKFGPYSRTELVAMMLRAESANTVNSIRQENALLLEDVQLRLTSGSILSARSLVDNAPDAIIIVSEDGTVEYANSAAHELFGYKPGELGGIDHNLLVPLGHRAKHAEVSESYFLDPSKRAMGNHLQTPATKKDGTVFAISANISAIESGSGTVVICTVRA